MHSSQIDSIEHWPLDRLVPYAKNARTHSEQKISKIAGSIAEFVFVNPILMGDDLVIVAGHGRLKAAQKLRLDRVPVMVLKQPTETQRRALVIADNAISANSGLNAELLHLELGALNDLGFDLDPIGFGDGELDRLLNLEPANDDGDADQSVPPSVFVGRGNAVQNLPGASRVINAAGLGSLNIIIESTGGGPIIESTADKSANVAENRENKR